MGDKVIVLSLDPSLSSTGYSILAVENGKVDIIQVGSIDNKKHAKKPHGFRLYQIFVELKQTIEKYNPTIVVKERGFSKGHKSTQALFKVAGVIDLLSHAKGFSEIEELSPLTVKRVVGGHGKASKEEVADGIRRYIDTTDVHFKNDDESDSVAVGLTWLVENKLI